MFGDRSNALLNDFRASSNSPCIRYAFPLLYDVVSSSSGNTGEVPFIPSNADRDKIIDVAVEEEEEVDAI